MEKKATAGRGRRGGQSRWHEVKENKSCLPIKGPLFATERTGKGNGRHCGGAIPGDSTGMTQPGQGN
jgi:hypothetical protein